MWIKGALYSSIFLTMISPLITALLVGASFFIRRSLEQYEKVTYRLVRFFYVMSFCSGLLSLLMWGFYDGSYGTMDLLHFNIDADFALDLRIFFDSFSLIFLATSTFITSIIAFFSHRYLHRDPGYRRFFIIISMLAFGINLVTMAGTFDLIFAAWEILGLSSFLLIGYFWHRPKAIAAACRAFYIYRVCDLGMLASILITHFFWHDANIFSDFLKSDANSVLAHIPASSRWLLSICILLPVLGKSAQFPFCFWLPKAMEGPTHSSAIFYGSLSIHAGVFLLLRTQPIWYFTPGFIYLLAGIGIITTLSATLFALVQSNIKGQIGYASIAQVGLMLIELSLNMPTLAFWHMIGNAFLRCFQLLVSSSILTTHLHMQNVVKTFGELHRFSLPNLMPKSIRPSLYIFAINDGFFEQILIKLFVFPTMKAAFACNSFINLSINKIYNRSKLNGQATLENHQETTLHSFSPMFAILFVAALLELVFMSNQYVRLISLIVALILALASLGERKNALAALLFAYFGNVFAFLSISLRWSTMTYLIGLIISGFLAFEALDYIGSHRTIKNLREYHGLNQQFPLAGTIFLFGILGMISFPMSSTFFGEDILLSLSLSSGLHYLVIFQFIFVITGISVVRLFSLVMLGKRDNFINESIDYSPTTTFLRITLFLIGSSLAFALSV